MRPALPRLLLFGAALATGCSTHRVATRSTGEAMNAEEVTPDLASSQAVALPDTTLCLVDRASPTGLMWVSAKQVVETGEVVITDGDRRLPLAERYPVTVRNGYAQGESWFIGNAPIRYSGAEYRQYGPQREIRPTDVMRGRDVAGVPVFLDPRDSSPPEILYVPVAPGCIFQPYRAVEGIRRIRGE